MVKARGHRAGATAICFRRHWPCYFAEMDLTYGWGKDTTKMSITYARIHPLP